MRGRDSLVLFNAKPLFDAKPLLGLSTKWHSLYGFMHYCSAKHKIIDSNHISTNGISLTISRQHQHMVRKLSHGNVNGHGNGQVKP